MGQRNCKVNPLIGEVCHQHLSAPPKPSINTAVQHPHPCDETPVDAGEGNSQERRVMERGGEEGGEKEAEGEERGGGEERKKQRKKKWWRRLHSFFRGESGEKEERRVKERGGGEEEKEQSRRLHSFFRGESGEKEERRMKERGGGSEEEEEQSRRLHSVFRAGRKQPGRSSDDYIFSRYSVGDELGKGGFGVVYEGRRLEDGLKVALKYVTKTQRMKYLFVPDHPNPLPLEIALTILANEGPSVPEVVRLLDWQDHPDHFVMILECPSPCENLAQFMIRHGGRLKEEKARHIMRQVVYAANVCCLRGVLHRDIKLGNLLINSETSEVKLIDFGCGDILRISPYRSYSGTAKYSPPEYHAQGQYNGRQATAWSLGILMFVMLCGHFPSDHDLRHLKKKRWSKPGLSTDCCDLLRALLRKKPSRRLDLGIIMLHNWFKVVT